MSLTGLILGYEETQGLETFEVWDEDLLDEALHLFRRQSIGSRRYSREAQVLCPLEDKHH